MRSASGLHEIKVGEAARIVSIEGDDAVALRLMEMGLTDGEVIEVMGASPFGDPVEYSVRGYRLVLRRKEAERVQVERIQSQLTDRKD